MDRFVRATAIVVSMALVVAAAAFAGEQLRHARAPGSVPDADPPAAQALGPAPTATPAAEDPFDGASLPRLDQFSFSVTPVPLTEAAGVSSGTKRVINEEGGWSLEVPGSWNAFHDRLRGAEIHSYDPRGLDYGGNVPPTGGIRIALTLWPDVERRGPIWYADHDGTLAPGAMRQRDSVDIGGIRSERAILRQGHPEPHDHVVALWFGSHPSFPDRVLRIEVSRAEGAVLAAAEAVVATLWLSEPVSGPRGPIVSRAEVVARYAPLTGKPQPAPTRIEAKLVLLKDIWLADPKGGRTFTLDLDTPVWVVMEWGRFQPEGRACRFGCDGVIWPWRYHMLDARAGTGFSFGAGRSPAEPPWWSALRDRSSDPISSQATRSRLGARTASALDA